ncbi:MAG: twin-arginine translocation signal domain-containing protein [Gemmataceae bacterium]|nr:twin-arginine translocation signal domain-containing protein [Gemmataceae bacterium]
MGGTVASRRDFLRQVGAGMVAASIGGDLADDLGVSTAFAADGPEELTFGPWEPLVALMQETPAPRLLPTLHERLRRGASLLDLVRAAALANARTFGGEDYVGFHTMCALAPAYRMAAELPAAEQALPIFKVLYRNTHRIGELGGRRNEVLRRVAPGEIPAGEPGQALRQYTRSRRTDEAERLFAARAAVNPDDSFNDLLWAVEDATDVHRAVVPYRARDLLEIIGREHALTLLRQSVRYCLKNEPTSARVFAGLRAFLPRLLDERRLLSMRLGTRRGDDAWVEQFSQTIFRSTAEQAADAVAAALAEGLAPESISEALALAANQLILRDNGRPANQAAPNRPVGSVHGDSIGVHSCDAVNAWRNMARVADRRNQIICLVLAGYQVAQDRVQRGGDFLNWQPYPRDDARGQVTVRDQLGLLRETEDAIRHRDQARAAAAAYWYGQEGYAARPMFDLLLKYTISDDGALHAEKFYGTVVEDYAAVRPAFRWRLVIALARVTASAHGQPAPGLEEARRLLSAH